MEMYPEGGGGQSPRSGTTMSLTSASSRKGKAGGGAASQSSKAGTVESKRGKGKKGKGKGKGKKNPAYMVDEQKAFQDYLCSTASLAISMKDYGRTRKLKALQAALEATDARKARKERRAARRERRRLAAAAKRKKREKEAAIQAVSGSPHLHKRPQWNPTTKVDDFGPAREALDRLSLYIVETRDQMALKTQTELAQRREERTAAGSPDGHGAGPAVSGSDNDTGAAADPDNYSGSVTELASVRDALQALAVATTGVGGEPDDGALTKAGDGSEHVTANGAAAGESEAVDKEDKAGSGVDADEENQEGHSEENEEEENDDEEEWDGVDDDNDDSSALAQVPIVETSFGWQQQLQCTPPPQVHTQTHTPPPVLFTLGMLLHTAEPQSPAAGVSPGSMASGNVVQASPRSPPMPSYDARKAAFMSVLRTFHSPLRASAMPSSPREVYIEQCEEAGVIPEPRALLARRHRALEWGCANHTAGVASTHSTCVVAHVLTYSPSLCCALVANPPPVACAWVMSVPSCWQDQ